MRRISTLLATTALAVAACGSPATPVATVNVVASTSVWGSVASVVAGDHAQVRSIIDSPTEDPHSYEASPADASAIEDAALVVFNGGGYDAFVDSALAQTPAVKRVDAFSVGGHPAEGNPHVFYDLDTVAAVAGAIADQLAAVDPSHAADFKTNAERFTAGVRDLATTERRIAAAHPGASVIATEDVAHYLAQATGLTDVTPPGYYQAVDADTDPAPADIAAVLDSVNSRAVRVVLLNPQTTTPVTQRIVQAADAAGVPVVEVTETMPVGEDFLTWQRHTVDRLGVALAQNDNHQQ